MIRNIQTRNFSHSGRGKRMANEITAGLFQFSSSSFLCALFGSLSLTSFLSSFLRHTLWQTEAPNHNLEKFQMDFVSEANTPLPTPAPGTRHTHWAQAQAWGQWWRGSVQPTELVAKISALVSANGSQRDRERLINCSQASWPPSALDTALLPLEH